MQLLDELRSILQKEESVFRAQLLCEDIARLEKLLNLADESEDLATFQKSGTYIGWTQNDMMTHRIADPLAVLLETIFRFHKEGPSAELDHNVRDAWLNLCKERNEKLIKCL